MGVSNSNGVNSNDRLHIRRKWRRLVSNSNGVNSNYGLALRAKATADVSNSNGVNSNAFDDWDVFVISIWFQTPTE